MSNLRILLATSALLLSGVAFIPEAVAHNCASIDPANACGPCPAGNHDHKFYPSGVTYCESGCRNDPQCHFTWRNILGSCANDGRVESHGFFGPGGAFVETDIPDDADLFEGDTVSDGAAFSTVFNTCITVPAPDPIDEECLFDDIAAISDPTTFLEVIINESWLDDPAAGATDWILGAGDGPISIGINWGCDDFYVVTDGWDGDYEIGIAGAFLPDETGFGSGHHNILGGEVICVNDLVNANAVPYVVGSDVDDDGDTENTTGINTGCTDVDEVAIPPGGPYTGDFAGGFPTNGGYWVFVGAAGVIVDSGTPDADVFLTGTHGSIGTYELA